MKNHLLLMSHPPKCSIKQTKSQRRSETPLPSCFHAKVFASKRKLLLAPCQVPTASVSRMIKFRSFQNSIANIMVNLTVRFVRKPCQKLVSPGSRYTSGSSIDSSKRAPWRKLATLSTQDRYSAWSEKTVKRSENPNLFSRSKRLCSGQLPANWQSPDYSPNL